MKALEMGYDILLEKPISPSERECRDILRLAKSTGRIVAVCHVLRYAPLFSSGCARSSRAACSERSFRSSISSRSTMCT